MRRIKLFVYGLATLVVLAIIAGGVFSLFFDLNGLKPSLAEAAKEQTGRDLTIDGDITVSLFPRVRATATDIKLSNVEGGSEPDVVTIDAASVLVSWLPLLTGSLDVRQVHAAGVRVLIEENDAGQSSIALEPAESESSGEPGPLPDIIDVRDIAVVTRGESGEQVYDVSRFILRPTAGGPTSLAVDATLNGMAVRAEGTLGDLLALGGSQPFPVALTVSSAAAQVAVDGSIDMTGEAPRLDFAVNAEGRSLAGLSFMGAALPATAPFTLGATASGSADRVNVDDLQFAGNGVELNGSASLDTTGARTKIAANLVAPRFDLDSFLGDDRRRGEEAERGSGGDVLSDEPLPLAALRSIDTNFSFSAASLQVVGVSLAKVAFEVVGREGLVEITRLAGELPEGTLNGSGRLDARKDTVSVAIDAGISGLDIAKVLAELDIPAQSARQASARVMVAASGATSRAIAENMTATIGLSDLEVTVDGAAPLLLTDATALFDGRDRPVALSVQGSVRGETIRVTGQLDPLSKYRPGEPYAFAATGQGAGATLRLGADMQAAMVEGLSVGVVLEGDTLAGLSRLMGSDLPAVGPYSMAGVLSFEEGAVSFSEARASFGQSDLAGEVRLSFGDGLPGITADLRAGLIDLTEFASLDTPTRREVGDTLKAGETAFLTDTPLDLGPLFGITADLNFEAATLRSEDYELQAVQLRVAADGDVVRLERLQAQVDGKSAQLSGSLQWTGTAAEVALEAEIAGIDADAILAESDLGERVDVGPLNIALTGTSVGNSRQALFDNAAIEAIARDFSLLVRTDDRLTHDSIALDSLTIATRGQAEPLTVAANGTFGTEALEVKATLEPLARLRLMAPVPLDISLQTATSHVRVSGKAPDRRRPSQIDFSVSAEGRIVREVAAIGGLSLNPEGPWRVGGLLSVDDGLVALKDAEVVVGTSDIVGSFEVRDGEGVTLVRARATSERLALTDFVPSEPPAPSEGEAAADADAPMFDTTPFDLAPLRALELDVGVQVKAFFGRTVAGKDLTLRAKAQDGLLTLDRFAASVGGEEVLATGRFDARGDRADMAVSLVGGPFDLGALMLEFSPSAGAENVVQLPVDIDVELAANGASPHDLAATANGKVDLIGGKGFVQQRAFRFLDQGLLRELTPWEKERTRTNINCFVGRFDVAEGVATSRALLLDAEFISVSGRGTIDLGQETLDLTLTPRPKEVRLLDLAVPVAVTGKLNDPSIAPTTTGAAKKVATTLGVLVNPLVLLVPVIEGVTAERNPCVAALENSGETQSEGGAVGGVIKGIGEGVEGIGRGIGRIFGGDKSE